MNRFVLSTIVALLVFSFVHVGSAMADRCPSCCTNDCTDCSACTPKPSPTPTPTPPPPKPTPPPSGK